MKCILLQSKKGKGREKWFSFFLGSFFCGIILLRGMRLTAQCFWFASLCLAFDVGLERIERIEKACCSGAELLVFFALLNS